MRGFPPKPLRRGNYANGGPVRGPGTGTSDDVETRVPEGSYVMPADTTQAVGEDAIAAMGAKRGLGVRGLGKSVPVNLSNGEYSMPPEQVHAVGVQALDELRQATHTRVPERGVARGVRGIGAKPELFFANGGLVDDEKNPISPSNIYPQGSPSAGVNIYGNLGDSLGSSGRTVQVPDSIGQQPGRTPPPPPAVPAASPAPAPTVAQAAPTSASAAAPDTMAGQAATGFFPHLQARGVRSLGGSPAPALATAATPATEVEGWRTKAVMDGAAQDAQAAWDRGGVAGVAGAAGAVTRGAVTAIPTAIGEFAYNTVAPVARGVGAFLGGLTGNAPAATSSDASAPTPARTTAGNAAPAAAAAPVGRGFGGESLEASRRDVTQQAATPTEGPTARGAGFLQQGVYQHGRGQYSDQAGGMGFSEGFTGQPSARNDAAAENLARGFRVGQIDLPPPAQRGPDFGPGFSGVIGQQGGNGNLWTRTPEQQRRDAEVQASSISRPTAALGVAGLRAMDATDLANARSQGDQQQERIRQLGAMSREGLQQTAETVRAGMRETGETARASARNQIDATRVGLEGRRVGMEERTRGISDRAAEQQEQLRAIIADPRTTIDARLQAQQSLRAFLGKGQEDHWKGVVLQGGVDANGVKTDSVLGAVNERTGEMRKMDSSQAASAKSQPLQNPTTRPVGTVSTLNGKTAVWDGKKWVANP